jgi:hypothetical protein
MAPRAARPKKATAKKKSGLGRQIADHKGTQRALKHSAFLYVHNMQVFIYILKAAGADRSVRRRQTKRNNLIIATRGEMDLLLNETHYSQFHHQVHLVLVLECLQQLHYVWVLQSETAHKKISSLIVGKLGLT